jgi:catechol 2,3-dioxygenase-like lactoylglutathione lyase family enzyme
MRPLQASSGAILNTTSRMLYAKLVPELLVTDIAVSIRFWRDLVGFSVAYERPEHGFVYLDLNGAHIMLEQRDAPTRHWITGPLTPPFGRGINLQIDVPELDPIRERLDTVAWPLFLEAEERWYRVGDMQVGVRQLLVQDPDGYLIRLAQSIGEQHWSAEHICVVRDGTPGGAGSVPRVVPSRDAFGDR